MVIHKSSSVHVIFTHVHHLVPLVVLLLPNQLVPHQTPLVVTGVVHYLWLNQESTFALSV